MSDFDKTELGFLAFIGAILTAALIGLGCLASWAVPHFFTGPCAFRGGYDRFEADYVVCGSGDRRAYDPKTKTFYDVKVMVSSQ